MKAIKKNYDPFAKSEVQIKEISQSELTAGREHMLQTRSITGMAFGPDYEAKLRAVRLRSRRPLTSAERRLAEPLPLRRRRRRLVRSRTSSCGQSTRSGACTGRASKWSSNCWRGACRG